MTFEQYQDYVNNYIATNGRNAITGNVMNVILQEIGEMLYSAGGGDITIGTTPIVSGVAGRILFEGADNVVRQSADLHWDSSNNRLGIGTTSPECTLDVRSQGTSNRRGIQVTHYDNTTAFSQAKVIGRRARGSVGSPSAVLANDSIASFNGSAYKETGWSDTLGGIYIYARQNFTDSATGTFITFRGINNGTTTVAEWVRINSRGMSIGWGGTDPGAVLDVRAAGSTASDLIFRVRNSSNTTNLFEVLGNGVVRSTNRSSSAFQFGGTYVFHQSLNSFSTNGMAMFELSNISGNNVGSLRIHNTSGHAIVRVWADIESGQVNGKITLNRNAVSKVNIAASNAGGFITGINYTSYINGVNPLGSTDQFDIYSADIVAGNAAPHFRTELGHIIKLYQQDLPTTPTTGEIATLLSNLGLANLI